MAKCQCLLWHANDNGPCSRDMTEEDLVCDWCRTFLSVASTAITPLPTAEHAYIPRG